MEKNRIMEAFLSLGLLVLAVLCVAVPFFVLFTGDGTYSWQFGDPATKKMMAEIALLFVLLSGILLLGKRPGIYGEMPLRAFRYYGSQPGRHD